MADWQTLILLVATNTSPLTKHWDQCFGRKIQILSWCLNPKAWEPTGFNSESFLNRETHGTGEASASVGANRFSSDRLCSRLNCQSRDPSTVLGSCPAATGNHAGGGRCVFQQCLFLQSVLVLLFCRSCSFTPRSGDENFKLLLSSRAHFCVGNVICCWCPGGIHGKSSCGLAPAYSAVCFEWKGGRTGEERVYSGTFHTGK